MRHLKSLKKLSRSPEHRRATLRNLVTSLMLHEKIETTDVKARAAKIVAEKLVTLAKRGTLHTRRIAGRTLLDPVALQKLFEEIGPRFMERNGGYTRIVKLGQRHGDAARTAILSLIPEGEKPKAKKAAAAPSA